MAGKNSKKLILYATTFNNVGKIRDSMNSVAGFGASEIYVTDNYSTDGTFEELSKHSGGNNAGGIKVYVNQSKSTRGWGRHIALERALEHAGKNDLVMYVDLDTIYRRAYIDEIMLISKDLKKNDVCYLVTLHIPKRKKRPSGGT